MTDKWVHTADGNLLPFYKIPGTKVRRKENLPFQVHSFFPLGVVKTISEPCGKMNVRQDKDREFAHVVLEENLLLDIRKGHCFHPYADTLEEVEE